MEPKKQKELEKELEALKLSNPDVRSMIVTLDSDDETKTATFFLRKPDKQTRSMVDKLTGNKQYEKAVMACLKNLYLGGDDLVILNHYDDAMVSADQGCAALLAVQAATIKKN